MGLDWSDGQSGLASNWRWFWTLVPDETVLPVVEPFSADAGSTSAGWLREADEPKLRVLSQWPSMLSSAES